MKPRRARRLYELARLQATIEENRSRMAELDAYLTRPCPNCVRMGFVKQTA